jgi:hypothetical protein
MVQLNLNKIAAFFSLLFFINSSAQSTTSSPPNKEFRINLETVMYQKLIESSSSGSSFNSRDALSGILSISNYYRLKHNFAIEPSVGLSVIPYNYNYNIQLEPSHPIYKNVAVISHTSTSYILPTSRVGVFVSKEFHKTSSIIFFTGLGVNLNTYPTYDFSSGVVYSLDDSQPDSELRFFDLNLTDGNYSGAFRSNLSYSAKIGLSKINNRGNGYSISLIFNLQPNEIGVGSYYFDLGTHKETGTLKWKNSYYGFCFSKTFNREKKE